MRRWFLAVPPKFAASSTNGSEIHVSLVIKAPKDDVRTSGLVRQSDTVVRHIVVVPTILGSLQIEGLPGSLGSSLIRSRARKHFAETHVPESPENQYALRDDCYKLIYAPEAGRLGLYDVIADPKEFGNLWSTRGAGFDEEREGLVLLGPGPMSGSIAGMSEETRERLRSLGNLPD